MASIWHDIEIDWNGETYRVRPTLDLINHLERKPGRSISQMMMRLQANDLPSGAACELIADVIRRAGGDVTPDQVYEQTAGIGVEVLGLASTVLVALLPDVKQGTTSATGAKKKAPAKRRKSTGAKSTE